MTYAHVQNLTREETIGTDVRVADNEWTRLKGLIGSKPLQEGEGLLITSSQGVHMWWMKFPLDVAMLDKDGRVVALYRDLQPGKRTRMHWDAHYALELPVGVIDESGTREGDVLKWEAGEA